MHINLSHIIHCLWSILQSFLSQLRVLIIYDVTQKSYLVTNPACCLVLLLLVSPVLSTRSLPSYGVVPSNSIIAHAYVHNFTDW